MQQRDIIKDEIEQLGRALGKLIANFIGIKTEGNVSDAIQITNTELQTELNIDVDELVVLDPRGLLEYVESENLAGVHLDQLAHYLFEIGIHKKSVGEDYSKWFYTAKRLLDIVADKSDTITFARIDLLGKIDKEIRNI